MNLHTFTDAELRARDERIIRAALDRSLYVGATWPFFRDSDDSKRRNYDAIIAAAEVDQ